MSEKSGSKWEDLMKNIPDEIVGTLVKQAAGGQIIDFQNQLRKAGENFIQRNDMFTAKVQSKRRITIPEASAEKLGIEEGDLVQFVITPVESQLDDEP